MKWHLSHARYGRKPWAVQVEYLKRADGRERFGCFLQQGLGKSAVNINEFIEYGDIDLNIVIPPNSFKGDWPLTPEEWGVGFLRTGMWPDDDLPHDWECGLYAIAQETLRGSDRARKALLHLFKTRRCMLTLDESSGIKNPQAELSHYVLELVKYAQRVRLLNGTPLVLNVMDYWAQLRALGQLEGWNPYAYRNRFAIMGGYMGRQVKGVRNEDELGRILDSCSFRALKSDWRKDLPPQTEATVHVEMTDNQRKHYATMQEEFFAQIGDDEPVTAEMVLTQRNKLQQLSSCLLMGGGKVVWLEPPNKNPKLKAILDLHSNGVGKSLVPYVYRASGEMLFKAFEDEGLKPAWISGGMKPGDITEQKRKFNKDGECRILVGQIDQTSRGHTLIGEAGNDRCVRTFYFENSLSLLHRLQMNDRNHRGEADQPVTLYDFVSSPVEQLNIDILTGKRSLADGMDQIVSLIRKSKGKV